MPKEKVSIGYRAAHLFTHHPWLKAISFVLAVLVWFYARGEITRFNY